MDLRAEDWLLIGLFSVLALVYLITKIILFRERYLLMKEQLASATSSVKLGHTVTRKFARIVANAEMTGKRQSVTVTPEFADAMYKVERHLEETLALLKESP